MFLDSDDTLQRDACRNLVEAARASHADLASGLTRRVRVRTGRSTEWYPWLYRSTRTLDSILDLPDLLVYDTLSTNKCYRRDFLLGHDLRFPVGVHYEDLLFSAQAYLAAGRIALTPHHVYNWMVDEDASTRSISNRRHEVENFAHRLRVHRHIDALLAERGLTELRRHKDTKFLKHDLVLHLRDLPFLGADYRTRFAALARGYLAELDPEAYAGAEPIHAICAYLLTKEDWGNLFPAIDTLINRRNLSAPLTTRDGRVYWCAEHLDDPQGRAVLDVTDLGYHVTPLSELHLRNALTGYRQRGALTELSGAIVNPLGRVAPDARLEASLHVRPRRGRKRVYSFPATEVRPDGDRVLWRAEAPLSRQVRPIGVLDPVWDVRVTLSVDGVPGVPTALTVGDIALDAYPAPAVRPRLTRLAADILQPRTSARGHRTVVLGSRGAVSRKGRPWVDRALRGAPGTAARAALRSARKVRKDLRSGETKVRVYQRVLCRLPIRKGTVVFESHLGRQYSDSPRALYEYLRREGLPYRAIWSYASRPEDFPQEARLVRRWSWAYLRALAQAEFWVDNQGLPLRLTKRPGTTYIQTWHGSALKTMGFDRPQLRTGSRPEQIAYQQVIDRFDHFLIRSEHDARTLAPAFRLPESKLVRSGYPRNDALVAAARGGEDTGGRSAGRALARELGVPEDRTVLLYAPTFRGDAAGGIRPFRSPFDFTEFADRFGDRCTLLVRSHYLNSVVLPPGVGDRVIDVSSVHDITPLLLAADALITDYSSVMFDYALLNRPMVFLVHDYDAYAGEDRGVYFDLAEKAPGPLVRDAAELYEVLDDLASADRDWAHRRKRFVEEFGEYDRGDAARRVVETFFRTGSGS
jgi:CDP-glycerol glycerophosphotransferase